MGWQMSHSSWPHLFRKASRFRATPSCPTPLPACASLISAATTSLGVRSRLITSRFESSSASSSDTNSSIPPPLQPQPHPSGRRFPRISVLVDHLRVSLAVPLSEIATLSISAALRFRHSDNNTHWPWSPSIYTLAHKRISTSAMLIEKQEKTALSEDVSQPEMTRDVAGESSSLPPAYSQVVGSSNYAGSSSNEKSVFGHTVVTRNGDDEDYVTNSPTNSKGIPGPSNLVHVFKRDGAIRGTWHIHPGLQIPASLMPQSPTRADTNYAKGKPWKQVPEDKLTLKETGSQPNLMLHTRDGSIHADVWVSDSAEQDTDEKKKQPTILDMNTRDGKISVRVRTHGTRPLDIRAYTNDGPITIFLPRGFTGLLQHHIRDGKLVFSPAMEASTTTFSSIQHKFGTSFIGDWQSLLNGGEAGIDTWEGDRCQVETRDGSIYFFWEDEFDAVMEKRKSNWLKALYWTN